MPAAQALHGANPSRPTYPGAHAAVHETAPLELPGSSVLKPAGQGIHEEEASGLKLLVYAALSY